LLRAANFNTLRIFLWHYALFICPGNDAVPHTPHVQRLDTIIQTAARYGFYLIVTLNDVPDLDNEPLYDNPIRAQNELRFIVERYRNESAILAWDLRNEGDIDYGTHPHIRGKFSKEQVLKWLGETSDFVRIMDNRHLITAGWLYDAEATAPYVDFISFHHWTTPDELKNRIQAIRVVSDKPILLEETGYSTFQADITPEIQAQRIRSIIETTRQENLIGWMIWTAFDFPVAAACYPSPCTSSDSLEHHFGLWYSDYTEKPAVAVIRDMAK
jgi:endo-1,4-beta-mannosidase